MNEIHLQRPDFAYSACEQFTKNKERIRKYSRFKIHLLKETRSSIFPT